MKIELSAHSRMRALERLGIESHNELMNLAIESMKTTNGIKANSSFSKDKFLKIGLRGHIMKVYNDTAFIFVPKTYGMMLTTVYPRTEINQLNKMENI